MRSLLRTPFTLLLAALLALIPLSSAIRLIESRSLNPCQANSKFSATLFNVIFTPDNRTLSFEIVGVSAIQGNVIAEFEVIAYGYTALRQNINPCENADLRGLCPMNTGTINIESNVPLSEEVVNKIPGIAYTIPDLDGIVQVYIHDAETGESLACVEAALSNGKTVYQKGVGWVTAIIAGTGLVASAITNGLGHSNTAAHVAANALSLFGYFQAQAFIGMSAVPLPPIVSSWTQNFQWSMGIIRIGFLQRMATWYQRSTGGTPSTILSTLATTSVQVQKRSLEVMHKLVSRALGRLSSRTNADSSQAETNRVITVRGIERVGFRAHIEITNIFLTGYSLFVVFVLLVIIGVILFKLIVEGLAKGGKMKGDKFQDFRNGWKTVLKGIMFRIVLIGFPQMVVLCFWELTQRDSAAEVALAILTIVTMTCILGWASSKVIRIAQRSIAMHKNPAYILYSDPVSLNKWGFLYVQFKATAYYFIVPVLFYVLLKGMFIGLGQGSAVVQAIALVLIEAGLLIAVSILRPYMDKKTNAFNISISAVNFVSAVFLLV
ncbi:putative flavin carrier protein 3, partial [Coniosporium apollinis]